MAAALDRVIVAIPGSLAVAEVAEVIACNEVKAADTLTHTGGLVEKQRQERHWLVTV